VSSPRSIRSLWGVHQRVEDDQPVAGHVDDGFGRPEVLHEACAHVVVAGAGDDRDGDGRQQPGGDLVLDVEPVVGQIPAQQHDVRLRRAGGDVVEGPAQSGGRLVGGPDMAIAQVRDDEPCHAGERTEIQLDSPAMSWRMCLISSVARA